MDGLGVTPKYLEEQMQLNLWLFAGSSLIPIYMVLLGQIVQFQYTPQILALLMWPRNLHLCSREDPELPDGFEEVDMYDFNTEEERVKEDEEEAREQEEREEQGATCGTQWFF